MRKILNMTLASILCLLLIPIGSQAASIQYINQSPEMDSFLHEAARRYSSSGGGRVGILNTINGSYEDTLTQRKKAQNTPAIFTVTAGDQFEECKNLCLPLEHTGAGKLLRDDHFALPAGDHAAAIGMNDYVSGILVNKTLLKKAGYEVSDIRDQKSLIRISDEIQRNAKRLGVDGAFTTAALSEDSIWRFSIILTGVPIWYEMQEMNADRHEILNGYRALVDLMLRDETTPSGQAQNCNYETARQEFLNRRAVFLLTGTWDGAALLNQNFAPEELAVIPLYLGVDDADQGLCSGSDLYWCISNKVSREKQQEAEKFLYWLTGTETGVNLCIQNLGVVPYKTCGVSGSVFYSADEKMMRQGKEEITPISTLIPSAEWKANLDNMLRAYALGNADWSRIEDCYADFFEKD